LSRRCPDVVQTTPPIGTPPNLGGEEISKKIPNPFRKTPTLFRHFPISFHFFSERLKAPFRKEKALLYIFILSNFAVQEIRNSSISEQLTRIIQQKKERNNK